MRECIENRMANNYVWENLEKKLHGAGYYNPRSGIFVPSEDAFDYMIEFLKEDPDKAEEMMEYFYQDWGKED